MLTKEQQEARENSRNSFKIILVITLLLVPVFLILCLIGLAGLDFKDLTTTGCIYRYPTSTASHNSAMVPTHKYQLNATANYSTVSTTDDNGNSVLRPDPNGYGSWLKTSIRVSANTPITLGVNGTVSLCRGNLVNMNLSSDSNLNTNGLNISLPRVEENQANASLINMDQNIASTGIPLVFNSQTSQWRNLAFIELYDNIEVRLLPQNTSNAASVANVFASSDLVNLQYTSPVDCSQQTTGYDPVCGLYTFYRGNIVSGCTAETNTTRDCITDAYSTKDLVTGEVSWWCCANGFCGIHSHNTCCPETTTTTYATQTSTIPYPYLSDNSRTLDFITDTSQLSSDLYNSKNCSNLNDYYTDPLQFWATKGNYLLWRLDSGSSDTNARGDNYNLSQFPDSDNIIYSGQAQLNSQTGYLQYRFYDNGNFATNTGGYVLKLKHTKCVRKNGVVVSDSGCADRGQIQYAILNGSSSVDSSTTIYNLPQVQSDSTVEITPASDGYLAFLITNNTQDYANSTGSYSITTYTQTDTGDFSPLLNRLIISLKTQVYQVATTIFSNMVCYQVTDKSSCVNFFTYIKALLTLYISFIGLQYILGINKDFDQYDLIIKIVKILIVAGLLNDTTFEWIFDNFYPLITNFTDTVISNISGYAPFNIATVENHQVYNPMMFLNVVFSNIFLSQSFMAQILSTLSYGAIGILYFLMVCLSVVLLLITCFKMICIYVMAFIGLAILISMTPIFLTFLLFDFTKKYFDIWLNFVFHFALEPVLLMIGVIILVQLFTINLDLALGFSTCWKCIIIFNMPFLGVGVLNGLTSIPLFCIYWFGPWGIDPISYPMSYTMGPFISLLIIAYVLYCYPSFNSDIMDTITGVSSGLTKAMEKGFAKVQKAIIATAEALATRGRSVGKNIAQDQANKAEQKSGSGQSGNEKSSESLDSSGSRSGSISKLADVLTKVPK